MSATATTQTMFGSGIYQFLFKDIELRVHPNPILGRGLFATKDIPEGTVICSYDDNGGGDIHQLISFDQMEEWRRNDPEKFDYHCRYSYQVDEEHLAAGDIETDAAFYMNHCCDPNVWFAEGKSDPMVARKLIKQGEELCYDYATTETMYLDFEKCVCGSRECRGAVKKTDWMIPELREKYGRHFMPYILHALDAQRGVLD